MSAFHRAQDGSLTLLSLLLFVVMFLLGGLAVDMLIYENSRARLQNVADRAALAAADLDQQLDPEAVVQSYFDKEGLGDMLTGVEVTSDRTGRTVTARAATPVRTMFMRMVGTTELPASAAATANESRSNIEISLVLDNSGSMATTDGSDGQTRLEKLKRATSTFLDTLYQGEADPEITVSVIPYSTQVNAGPHLLGGLNTTEDHAFSHCLDFRPEDFATTQLDQSAAYQQGGHYDPFNSGETPGWWTCRPESSQHILPLASDPARIMDQVNSLIASGQTSLDIGAKWGAGLLDPTSNGLVRRIADEAGIDPRNLDRPFAHDDAGAIKVLVLMTDGINTFHYQMRPHLVSGDSDMHLGDGRLEDILFDTPGLTPAVSRAEIDAWGLADREIEILARALRESGDEDGDGLSDEGYWLRDTYVDGVRVLRRQFVAAVPGASRVMQWNEIWNRMTVNFYAAEYVYRPRSDYGAYRGLLDGAYDTVTGNIKDTQLFQVCDAVKAQGVVVYTVGVHSDSHSRQVLSNCASTENFFLDVTSDDMEDAFRRIAQSVVKLRLTQ